MKDSGPNDILRAYDGEEHQLPHIAGPSGGQPLDTEKGCNMTANGELLRQLFRGYTKRDDATFRAAAEAIIREERTKNHRLLADDLERLLLNGHSGNGEKRLSGNEYEVPKDRERGFPLMDIAEYSYSWERIVLMPKTLEALQEIAVENKKRDILASSGLKPTQRVLFYGPPGCGKTLAARVLAGVLALPLITVRFDAIVSSFLGETAANLRRVFDFIGRGHWVVLFDEFDAIGKDRDNPFEHGELKRVVNSLLQLMDAFTGESLLIAATNHEKLLDEAIWRRFESVVHFPLPTPQDRLLLLRLFLGGFDTSGLSLERLSRRIREATGSDIETIAISSARRAVLDGRTNIKEADIAPAIRAFKERSPLSGGHEENRESET